MSEPDAQIRHLREQIGLALERLSAHDELLRRWDEPYRKRATAGEAPVIAEREMLNSRPSNIVRGRWCITALRSANIPGAYTQWDEQFDDRRNNPVYSAVPTCFGEMPLSYYHYWATRHVLFFEGLQPFETDYLVARTGGIGVAAILKFNATITILGTPHTSVTLAVRRGVNRLAIISVGGVELYGFGQFLGSDAKWVDKGCGNMAAERGGDGGNRWEPVGGI